MKRRMMMIFMGVVATCAIMVLRSPWSLTATTPGNTPRPNHADHPTAFPTLMAALPPMTAVPTSATEPTKRVPVEPVESPTPIDDQMPYFDTAAPFRNPSIEASTSDAESILIGTVMEVAAARWTTPDGQRPAHPHSQPGRYSIYRPISLHVEEQLAGMPVAAEVVLYGVGGQVGQDAIAWTGDDLHTFVVGERIIVWLRAPEMVQGQELRQPIDRYTLTGETAQNIFRSLPLAEVRQRITTRLRQR